MGKKGNIRLGLHALVPAAKLMLLRHVVLCLTGNASYPNLPVSLAQLGALGDALEDAIKKAMQGGVADRELRNALVTQVDEALTQTANYVRSAANGDRQVLSTSGFTMARSPEAIGVPLPPLMKAGVATGRPGEVELRFTRERGTYVNTLHICYKDPTLGADWEEVATTTRSRYTATGLPPYQAVWFSVSATGAAGESALSEPILVRAA